MSGNNIERFNEIATLEALVGNKINEIFKELRELFLVVQQNIESLLILIKESRENLDSSIVGKTEEFVRLTEEFSIIFKETNELYMKRISISQPFFEKFASLLELGDKTKEIIKEINNILDTAKITNNRDDKDKDEKENE